MSHVLKEVLKNISIDCVVFGFENSSLEVLLIKRARNPLKIHGLYQVDLLRKKNKLKKLLKEFYLILPVLKNYIWKRFLFLMECIDFQIGG